jgi:hypothetical protein
VATSFLEGSLIQATVGSAGGSGRLRTNRSACGVGGVQDDSPVSPHSLSSAVVHVGGSMKPDTRVAVFFVIPTEEPATEVVSVLEAAEAVRVLGVLRSTKIAVERALGLLDLTIHLPG